MSLKIFEEALEMKISVQQEAYHGLINAILVPKDGPEVAGGEQENVMRLDLIVGEGKSGKKKKPEKRAAVMHDAASCTSVATPDLTKSAPLQPRFSTQIRNIISDAKR